MTGSLYGGAFAHGRAAGPTELDDLRSLVDDLGRHSFASRAAAHCRAESFDDNTWRRLEDAGLTRLSSSEESGEPAHAALVLYGLARHAVAVPLAETDLLATWLAQQAGLHVPATGALTVLRAEIDSNAAQVSGIAYAVPWSRASSAAVVLACDASRNLVAVAHSGELNIGDGQNMAGEPRDTVSFSLPRTRFAPVDSAVVHELALRGAWARCVQIIGVLDTAANMSVTHVCERQQFGRPLRNFQAVQHAVAGIAGEIERARAATELAVAAAQSHGFHSPQARYAVTLAKSTLSPVVVAVCTAAHQLHGAIGTTLEHPLRLYTNRAYSWIGDFSAPSTHARCIARNALRASPSHTRAWDLLTGADPSPWVDSTQPQTASV